MPAHGAGAQQHVGGTVDQAAAGTAALPALLQWASALHIRHQPLLFNKNFSYPHGSDITQSCENLPTAVWHGVLNKHPP